MKNFVSHPLPGQRQRYAARGKERHAAILLRVPAATMTVKPFSVANPLLEYFAWFAGKKTPVCVIPGPSLCPSRFARAPCPKS